MDELLNSEALSENVKSSISEAWETQINEARENITAELREEFAQRYDADKAQIVEAMDSMIGDVIAKELEEFQADHNKLAEDRVAYRKHMKEHANVLDSFVMDTLRKEIKDLREDRVVQESFNKYLPSVLKDDAKVETNVKKVISESNTNEITGDKQPVAEATAGAEIINLRKLAGIS